MVEEILSTRHLDTEIGSPDETTGVAGRSRTLFYLMTQLTKKAARKMVKAAPAMHGYEAYRRLSRHYGTATAEASTGILLQILRFSFGSKLDEVEERLSEFTQLVDRHDQVTGLEAVAPIIKRAVLLGNVPEPLKTHLQLNSVNLETFDKVYSAAAEYLRGRRIYETTAGGAGKQGGGAGHKDDPMDVDALWKKGKGKGKGKDKKGKGKGKDKKGKAEGNGKDKGKEAKTPRFEGYCRSCGKWGHRASDCWAKAEVQAVDTGQLAIQDGQAAQQPKTQPQQSTQMIGEVIQPTELQPWIFAVTSERMITYVQHDKDMVRLLVDSGCFGHVCTRWCFPHSPLVETTGLSAQTANSSVIKHYGEKQVAGMVKSLEGLDHKVIIRFRVMDVKRPILSTHQLKVNGIGTIFDASSSELGDRLVMHSAGAEIPLLTVGEHSYLQFYPWERTWDDSSEDAARMIMTNEQGEEEIDMEAEEEGVELQNMPDGSQQEVIGELPPAGSEGAAPEEQTELTGETLGARPIRCPVQPSSAEYERHCLTHVPFRSWCHYCVVARARSSPHRKIVQKQVDADDPHAMRPRWQLDFMFMRLVSEPKTTPCLTAVERRGCVLAHRLPTKAGHEKLAAQLVVEMEALGFAGPCVLQGDQENSLKPLMRRMAGKDQQPQCCDTHLWPQKGHKGLWNRCMPSCRDWCDAMRHRSEVSAGSR